MRQEQYQQALSIVNAEIAKVKQSTNADIAHILHLLVQKSRVFAAAGQAPKGFSLALRAAATAERYKLISVLTEALGALGKVLNEMSECQAAREVLQAALPLVSTIDKGGTMADADRSGDRHSNPATRASKQSYMRC